MGTSARRRNEEESITAGNVGPDERQEQLRKLFQISIDPKIDEQATGSQQTTSGDKSTEGRVLEVEKTERYKQAFWQHSKKLINLAFAIGSVLVIGFFLWYINHSNKIAADNSKILTEIDNLKDDIGQMKNDSIRDIDYLRRQVERLFLPYPEVSEE